MFRCCFPQLRFCFFHINPKCKIKQKENGQNVKVIYSKLNSSKFYSKYNLLVEKVPKSLCNTDCNHRKIVFKTLATCKEKSHCLLIKDVLNRCSNIASLKEDESHNDTVQSSIEHTTIHYKKDILQNNFKKLFYMWHIVRVPVFRCFLKSFFSQPFYLP